MSNLDRTTCIVCASDVAARKDGTPREHVDKAGFKCHGSRKRPMRGRAYVHELRWETRDWHGEPMHFVVEWAASCRECGWRITCPDIDTDFARLSHLAAVHRCTDVEDWT